MAPDYSSLKGRLEYSAARQQWKLRYIPIDIADGQVDQYGGSVVLSDVAELKQFHDGDFVSVQVPWASEIQIPRTSRPLTFFARLRASNNASLRSMTSR